MGFVGYSGTTPRPASEHQKFGLGAYMIQTVCPDFVPCRPWEEVYLVLGSFSLACSHADILVAPFCTAAFPTFPIQSCPQVDKCDLNSKRCDVLRRVRQDNTPRDSFTNKTMVFEKPTAAS